MSIEEKIKLEQLQSLTDLWNQYKAKENEFKEKRVKIENEAYDFLKDKLKDRGTYTAETNLQVTTGEDEKWTQVEIIKLKNMFDNGELNTLPFFPFDVEYKPNNAKLKLLKETDEKQFYKVFGEALTTKPKKPSFKIKK